MSAATLSRIEKSMKYAWRQSNRRDVEMSGSPFDALFDPEYERLDADWWEPTTRWRREMAEERDYFGTEDFGKPSAPVEGPHNPNRLRRELKSAESSLSYAEGQMAEAKEEADLERSVIERIKAELS